MCSGRVGCVGERKVARFGGLEMADGASFGETATCISCAISIDYHSSSSCVCSVFVCVCVCVRVCVCVCGHVYVHVCGMCLEYVGMHLHVYICECVFNIFACYQVGLNQVSTSWTSLSRGARSCTEHGVLPDNKLTLYCEVSSSWLDVC